VEWGFDSTKIARSFVGFGDVIPKGFKGIIGSLVIGVADQHNYESNEKDPAHSVHKINLPQARMQPKTLSRQKISQGQLE
jgi:hypothetical protein